MNVGRNIRCEKKCNWEAVMTTRSICISAAVLLLALTLTWPALPEQSNTDRIGQSSEAGAGKLHGADVNTQPTVNQP
jgi:hypothetical protein